MVRVNFPKENISIMVEENTSLADAVRKAGLSIDTPCNGMGICGKCKIIAKGSLSPLSHKEKYYVDEDKNERLACMAKVTGDTEAELMVSLKEMKSVSKGYSINVPMNPPVKVVKLPSINRASAVPYGEGLNYHISSLNVYKKLAEIEEKGGSDIYAAVFENSILDIFEENRDIFGVAIDIGTTGISYYLVDLKSGKAVEALSNLNPQVQYGGDVLTRISYCINEKHGTDILQRLITEQINKDITKLLKGRKGLYHITASGNTTMIHILLGINPASLAKAPYRPVFLNKCPMAAKDIGLDAEKGALLSVLPAASAYVGGDIISGIMASGFENNQRALYIDIGTNGEIAAVNDGHFICTSTAAGPALEGMNIECGCRAVEGAIEAFEIDEDFNMRYSSIGDADPVGICGSGLIDIAGALVKRGIVLESGRWNKDLNEKILPCFKEKRLYITDKIYISQQDIRQIQLAKGAIAAGVVLALKKIGLNIEDIPLIYISGAFGYHVNPENMKITGIIPKGFTGEIFFAGNTSLEGARLSLISKDCLEKAEALYKNMEVLELSAGDEFQREFISQLKF